ncbi:tetratricopeptide repeat protein [Bradyrhizobium sp. th.b2]|uniref:tetratricopeptide repeat protein n=1 Tax=Bradyrhizobium sp. th-b2 TaxID=172088 RepID=UPI003527AF7C
MPSRRSLTTVEEIALDKGETDEAIADYSHAIELSKDYATAYIGRANAFADKSNWAAALKDYDVAIAVDPKDPTAYNNRGTAHQNAGELDKAISDYDKAIALDPKRAAFHFNRGLAFHLMGKASEAFSEYTETTKLDPKYAFAYHNRGLISRQKGNLDEAISDFSRAIEINPSYAQDFASRGLAYLKRKQLKEAIDDLQKGLQLDNRQTGAMIGLGKAYIESQAFDQAKPILDQAIRLDPVSPEAYLQRGRLMEGIGDLAQASSDYRTALSFDPELKEAKEALSKVLERSKVVKIDPAIEPTGRLNRVALVIGNGTYEKATTLPNAVNDASIISEALRRIGFRQVIQVQDLGRQDLLAALRNFRELADHSEWAMIYYAGHGIEIDGQNYIVPVDARLLTDRDAPDEAISLSRFLDAIEGASAMKLVILDACREDPFNNSMKLSSASRTIGRGLARIEPEGGTLVAYSAKHGQVALDGTGANSPFATALANRMMAPNVEIRKLFGLVRDDVLAATSRKQEPFIYGTLGGDDHFINPTQSDDTGH